MNIAKKLLFALLLCGATFAVACEDEGAGTDNNGAFTGAGTAGKDAACKKTPTKADEKCKADYACVADSAGATSGKCATKCNAVADNDATCASKDATKNACAEKDGVDGKVKVCVAGTQTGGDKVKLGKDCSAATAQCEDALECVEVGTEKKCLLKCSDVSGCSDASKAGANNTACEQLPKKGSTADKEKVCTKPAPKLTVGQDCSANTAECGDGLECVDAAPSHTVCAFKCSDNTGCTDSSKAGQGMIICQQINKKGSTADKEKVCGPVAKVAINEECNGKDSQTEADAKPCMTGLVCVTQSGSSKCAKKCEDATASEDCTGTETGGANCSVTITADNQVPAGSDSIKVCGA